MMMGRTMSTQVKTGTDPAEHAASPSNSPQGIGATKRQLVSQVPARRSANKRRTNDS